MANSEMDYMNVGGGRYEIARVTATTSMTYKQVLTALYNNAGSNLDFAVNNYAGLLKLQITASNGGVTVLSFTKKSSTNYYCFAMSYGITYLYHYIMALHATDSKYKYVGSNAPSTYADGTNDTVDVSEAGEWILFYEK